MLLDYDRVLEKTWCPGILRKQESGKCVFSFNFIDCVLPFDFRVNKLSRCCVGTNCMQWSAMLVSRCLQAITYHTFVPHQATAARRRLAMLHWTAAMLRMRSRRGSFATMIWSLPCRKRNSSGSYRPTWPPRRTFCSTAERPREMPDVLFTFVQRGVLMSLSFDHSFQVLMRVAVFPFCQYVTDRITVDHIVVLVPTCSPVDRSPGIPGRLGEFEECREIGGIKENLEMCNVEVWKIGTVQQFHC